MARAWAGASARILRQAKGAPEARRPRPRHPAPRARPRPRPLRLRPAPGASTAAPAPRSAPAASARRPRAAPPASAPQTARPLDDLGPAALAALDAAAAAAARALGDAHLIEFAVEDGELAVLDAVPVRRTGRAAVRIAVDLVHAGAITRDEALLRIEPRSLIEHLHPQIDPAAPRDVFATGLAASPGAATGRVVFTAEAAQAAAAQDEATILVRTETSPEDIRGMHAARGVLTVRGGMSSHAAVIARGLGLPCVVGASELRLDPAAGAMTTADGRVLREGALITLDGTRGEVLAGAPAMIPPELGGAFSELLDWADAARDLGVRANADTPAEARMARDFRVDGLGLCRSEHMFFDAERITVMREMILADTDAERRAALDRLLPMQRADFTELFEIMRGLPVTIRLLDPPLHEFLPQEPEEIQALAEAMGLPVAQVTARARELAEVNPMLGMRGVRLGVTMPAIYDMQARAIFEAAIAVNRDARAPVVPEVMIPLVSAHREVELVKARIDAIAAAVQQEQGATLTYKLGVMVETPRAALRAGDLAASSAFLSFGTNDLTQMTYGLSRDDAGRFMRDYVNRGVFHEDPVPLARPRGGGRADADRRQARPRAATRTWCSASAASTAATPPRCASARSPASTTSPARPSACRSRASPPRRPRSSPRRARRGRRTPRNEAAARRSAGARRGRQGRAGALPVGARERPRRPGADRACSTPPGGARAASRSASPARRASENPPSPMP